MQCFGRKDLRVPAYEMHDLLLRMVLALRDAVKVNLPLRLNGRLALRAHCWGIFQEELVLLCRHSDPLVYLSASDRLVLLLLIRRSGWLLHNGAAFEKPVLQMPHSKYERLE